MAAVIRGYVAAAVVAYLVVAVGVVLGILPWPTLISLLTVPLAWAGLAMFGPIGALGGWICAEEACRIIVLARAISHGATGFIIDRAGHFEFLASLIPGAVSVEIGGDAHAVNCWDVEDPARVGAEKIDYLLALHALLLGEHHAGRDSYGLTDLEANLLGTTDGLALDV